MNPTPKTRVRRVPKRGAYDPATLYHILDQLFMCNVGFVHEGYPVVIPTLYGRKDNQLFLHGATTSRMLTDLKQGIEVCISVSHIQALVLARSALHHSVNYESAVIFGKAYPIEEREAKLEALKCISDQVLKGRWEEVRQPADNELKATQVLGISLDEASSKIRAEGVKDEAKDYELAVWAGLVPIQKRYGSPEPDPLMEPQLPIPNSVQALFA